jgi:hypothetical protein
VIALSISQALVRRETMTKAQVSNLHAGTRYGKNKTPARVARGRGLRFVLGPVASAGLGAIRAARSSRRRCGAFVHRKMLALGSTRRMPIACSARSTHKSNGMGCPTALAPSATS